MRSDGQQEAASSSLVFVFAIFDESPSAWCCCRSTDCLLFYHIIQVLLHYERQRKKVSALCVWSMPFPIADQIDRFVRAADDFSLS